MAITRVSCSVDGFDDNWIEYDLAGWTLRNTVELDGAGSADPDKMFEAPQRFGVACYITAGDEVIEDCAALELDNLLDADELLVGWLTGSIYTAIGARRALGNVSARIS